MTFSKRLEIKHLVQEPGTYTFFFCKDSDSKYLRPYGLYSGTATSNQHIIRQKEHITSEYGYVYTQLYLQIPPARWISWQVIDYG